MKYLSLNQIKVKPRRGFTLIELLVVIAIIGLLASVVMASLNSARAKGRDAKRLSEVREMQKALELYYDANGYYPQTNWISSGDTTWQTSSFATALRPYLSQLPVDPTNTGGPAYGGGYVYSYYSSGYLAPGQTNQQWYMIVFRLENQTSPAQTTDGAWSCGTGSNTLPRQLFHYGNDSNGIMTVGGNCI
jgi:type II secretion system protein G